MMNLASVRNAITSKAGRQILTIQKHSPAILFAAGVVGVAATVVLACRATLKVHDILDEHEETLTKLEILEHPSYSESDRTRDKTLLYFQTGARLSKLYAPSVLTGIASIAALTGAHIVLNRRNVALTAAYAALDKGFRAYRDRVRKELGDEKDLEFRYGSETRTIVEETDKGPVTKDVKQVGPDGHSIYARWFDDSCSPWQKQPEYNRIFLKCQQNYMNDLLKTRGHVFLNDVYDALGMKRTQPGSVVGWILGNGDDYIDFGIFNGDSHSTRDFINGWADRVLCDFNVDGIIWDKI